MQILFALQLLNTFLVFCCLASCNKSYFKDQIICDACFSLNGWQFMSTNIHARDRYIINMEKVHSIQHSPCCLFINVVFLSLLHYMLCCMLYTCIIIICDAMLRHRNFDLFQTFLFVRTFPRRHVSVCLLCFDLAFRLVCVWSCDNSSECAINVSPQSEFIPTAQQKGGWPKWV